MIRKYHRDQSRLLRNRNLLECMPKKRGKKEWKARQRKKKKKEKKSGKEEERGEEKKKKK